MGCSHRENAVKWGGGVWPNHHITFVVANSLSCSIYGIFGGRELVENVIWGEWIGWKRQITVIWGEEI